MMKRYSVTGFMQRPTVWGAPLPERTTALVVRFLTSIPIADTLATVSVLNSFVTTSKRLSFAAQLVVSGDISAVKEPYPQESFACTGVAIRDKRRTEEKAANAKTTPTSFRK